MAKFRCRLNFGIATSQQPPFCCVNGTTCPIADKTHTRRRVQREFTALADGIAVELTATISSILPTPRSCRLSICAWTMRPRRVMALRSCWLCHIIMAHRNPHVFALHIQRGNNWLYRFHAIRRDGNKQMISIFPVRSSSVWMIDCSAICGSCQLANSRYPARYHA